MRLKYFVKGDLQMKKIISFFLSLCFILTPITAFAENMDVLSDSYYEYFSVDHFFYPEAEYNVKILKEKDTTDNLPFVLSEGNVFYENNIIYGSIGNSNVVFFSTADTIYRYHIDSNKVDIIINNDEMIWFYPLSDFKVIYGVYNENEPISRKQNITCSITPLDNCSYFIFDSYTGINDEVPSPHKALSMTGYKGAYYILQTKRSSYTIGNATIPLPGYNDGDKYTGSYGGGYECHGFGLYVYAQMWGSHTFGEKIYLGAMNSTLGAKQLLSSLPDGSLVRFNDSDDEIFPYHTVIVLNASSSGITVYDANSDGNDTVRLYYMSYSTVIGKWDRIEYVRIPCDSHALSNWISYDSQYHCKKCNSCDYKQNFGLHYATVPGTNVSCNLCNYVGNISIGIQSIEHECM